MHEHSFNPHLKNTSHMLLSCSCPLLIGVLDCIFVGTTHCVDAFGARDAADAAAGVVKRSAHRCDELHAALMASCTCEAAVWSAVVPQRVRAIGHCLQRSMRCTNNN